MFDSWHDFLDALASLIMLPSIVRTLIPPSLSPKRLYNVVVTSETTTTNMDDFLAEARSLLEGPLQHTVLLDLSARMHAQYRTKLQEPNSLSMLPSYNHTLPTGDERGTYLALDVGGSTFRVALVELNGKDMAEDSMKIVKMVSYKVDEVVRGLRGRDFFDWMAERIERTLEEPEVRAHHGSDILPMGLAWSFPIKCVQPVGSPCSD